MGVDGNNGTILGEGTGSLFLVPERSFSSAEPLGWGKPATVAGRVLARDWPPHERDLCSATFDLKVDQTLGFRTAWLRAALLRAQRWWQSKLPHALSRRCELVKRGQAPSLDGA